MKKKILLISNNFWPENFRSNDVAKLLCKDYDLTVLTGYPTYPSKIFYKNKNFDDNQFTVSNFHICRVPTLKKTYTKTSTVFNYLSFIVSGLFVGFFLLKNKKFDYIICFASSPIYQSILSILFSKIKKAKSIVWIQDIWPETLEELGYVKNKFFLKIFEKTIFLLYTNHKLILTQSLEYFLNIKKRFSNSNYLYNPVDKFEKEIEKPKNINFLEDYRYLVYSGNIGIAQNFDLLLNAANKLKSKKLKFLLIGNGSRFNHLKNKINNESLYNVELHNAISKKELSYVLRRADVLFISLKENKISRFIIPAKFQTYTFFGKPILCQIEGDVKKLVKQNKCGFIVKNEKLESMLEELNKIINFDSDTLAKMGKNSKTLFDKYFNNEVFLKSFKNIIDET